MTTFDEDSQHPGHTVGAMLCLTQYALTKLKIPLDHTTRVVYCGTYQHHRKR